MAAPWPNVNTLEMGDGDGRNALGLCAQTLARASFALSTFESTPSFAFATLAPRLVPMGFAFAIASTCEGPAREGEEVGWVTSTNGIVL